MKRILYIALLLLIITPLQAEKRYYLIRGGNLPTTVETVDLRPETELAAYNLSNVDLVPNIRYALFRKSSDSWFQILTETATGRRVNLSDINSRWSLCLKIRRTVDYPLTLVLFGAGVANGYTILTSMVPADGQWRELVIPLSTLSNLPDLSENYTGRLLQLHSELGFTGNEVGIDYAYLTDDPTTPDPGTEQPEQRLYLITNSTTPLVGTRYAVQDYSMFVQSHADGWMQWSYIPFPYYSMTEQMPVAYQLVSQMPNLLNAVDDEWYLIAYVRTNIDADMTYRLYVGDNVYADTLRGETIIADNRTWNRVCVPLAHMTHGQIRTSTDIVFALTANDVMPGEYSIATLMLSNSPSSEDSQPRVPADPSQETRIYLLGDDQPLPEAMTTYDYRLFYTSYLNVGYGNNTTRATQDSYLTLLPTNGWWSADITASQPVDLSMVDATWAVRARVRATTTYRPINMIFYSDDANHELRRYTLSAEQLPSTGEWKDISIPMAELLGSQPSLPTYSGNHRVFTLHSDNGGSAGLEVSVEYLYFVHEGESRPDPQPGLPTLDEPAWDPVPEGWNSVHNIETKTTKFIHNGQLLLRRDNHTYNLMGVLYQ